MRANPLRPYNIGQHYLEVAHSAGNFPAIIGETFALSHGDFAQVIRKVSREFATMQIGTDSIVALNSTNLVAILATLLATGLNGSGFCIANPTLAHFKTIAPTHFLRTPEVAGHPSVPFSVLSPDFFELSSDVPVDEDMGATDPLAPWMYLHTSGTTGSPKFISLSQQLVRDRSAAVVDDFPERKTTFASFFPPTSRPFLARAIAALLQGCAVVEGINVHHWQTCGVNFVSASPSHMHKMLYGQQLPRKIERLEVSGSKITLLAAQDYMKNFNKVVDVYGASETSKSFSNILEVDTTGEVISVGAPRDSTVEIVGQDSLPCKPGQLGSVRVRNTYMATGYIEAPAATEKAFRGGWFYPGDIASWGRNGELDIFGRDDEVINVGGYKLQAALVDSIVCNVVGVQDAVVFRNPLPNAADPLLAFVIFRDEDDRHKVSEEIVDAFSRAIGFGLTLRNIKAVSELPRDENGNLDRRKCSEMVLARARKLGELQ